MNLFWRVLAIFFVQLTLILYLWGVFLLEYAAKIDDNFQPHKRLGDNFQPMGTILSRIKALAEHEDITITALERVIGASKGVLSRAITNGTDIQSKWIQAIVENYPHISAAWLLTGRGDMLLEKSQSAEIKPSSQLENDFELEDIVHISKIKTKDLPLIPYEAAAGFLRGEEDGIRLEDCEHYRIPFFTDADFLIYIVGDSMLPTFNSGDLAACKFVPPFDLFFQWGKPYIVATDEGILLKRVYESGAENVSFISDNEKYSPITFPRKQIYQVARVLGVVRHD